MAKEVYSKMSQYGTSSISAMKASNADIPAFISGRTNKKIPVSDFASADDVSAIDGKVESLKEQVDVIANREPSTKEVVTVATADDLDNVQDPSTEVIYKTLDENRLYIYDGRVFIDVTGHAVDSTVYAASIVEILTMTLEEGVYSVLIVAGSAVTATYSLGVSSGSMVLSDKDGWADVSGGAWRWHSYSYEGHRHTLAEVTDYAIDSAMSETSDNPVKNRVINAALSLKGDASSVADTIELSIDSSTYEVQARIKKGNTLIAESNKIDLPLETMVVGGYYDSQTKHVVLTLKNGQTVEFSVADLVEGLAPSNHTHVIADITDYKPINDGGAVSSSNIGALQNDSAYTYGYTGTGNYALLDFVVEAGNNVPNVAIKIVSTAQTDGTVNVYKLQDDLYIPLMPSVAGGTTVEAGKTYQLTCVGDCWTLAEFVDEDKMNAIFVSGKKYNVSNLVDVAAQQLSVKYQWTDNLVIPSEVLSEWGFEIGFGSSNNNDPDYWDGSTPRACYWEDDNANQDLGMFFNEMGLAVLKYYERQLLEYLGLAQLGFRLPTNTDMDSLAVPRAEDLKTKTGWTYPGTDATKFHAAQLGRVQTSQYDPSTYEPIAGSWADQTSFFIASIEDISAEPYTPCVATMTENSGRMNVAIQHTTQFGYPVRLCRTLDPDSGNPVIIVDGQIIELQNFKIGGKSYPCVKIGNKWWMAENLDYKFSGLTVGASGSSDSEPRGNYYDNNEAFYGANGARYGLMYNFPAVQYLGDHPELLPAGWRVPTMDDWNNLITTVGGASVAGRKLKSASGWVRNGIDSYKLSIQPGGQMMGGSFSQVSRFGSYWTATSYDSFNSRMVLFTFNDNSAENVYPNAAQLSLRLCMDVT